MKKHSFLLPAAVFAAFFTSQAQFTQAALTEPNTEHHAKATVPLMVQGRFQIAYPNVTDDTWILERDGYFVNFISQDGVHCNVWLNKKGKMSSQIRYLNEAGLPAGVRQQVNNLGGCYTIGSIKEVTTKLGTVYLITLRGANDWKVMRVAGNEMDVYEEHQNG